MRRAEVRRHWEKLAGQYGTGLGATTKTSTIKRLEIAALQRAFARAGVDERSNVSVLEVGCGNGWNCLALAAALPAARFTGVDLVPEMIENAREAASAGAKPIAVTFEVGDVLTIDEHPALDDEYDVVFTDRCLINLTSTEEHVEALRKLTRKVRAGGHLVLIENTTQAFGRQNDLREAVSLPPRTPPTHNVFIDEDAFLTVGRSLMELIDTDEFAALHDLVLYVLVPATNDAVVNYEHPLVEAATELLLERPDDLRGPGAGAGQNRLFLFRRPSAGAA